MAALRKLPEGEGACIIGRTLPAPAGRVTLRTALAARVWVDMLVGDQLPRIC